MKISHYPCTLTAIKAANGRKTWGRFAAMRFVQKSGIHPALYRLACQLEAIKGE